MMDLKIRQKLEADFWDREAQKECSLEEDLKYKNNMDYKEYFSIYPCLQYVADFFGDINAKTLLNLGCGTGPLSVYFARSGALSYSCDISSQSIEMAKKIAKANSVEDKMKPFVMAAEKLEFPDETFDFIFGKSILHHIDIQKVGEEVSRVLKKGGKAVFIEPLGYNYFYSLYWRFTPHKHSPAERLLKYEDIKSLSPLFSDFSFREFHLFDQSMASKRFFKIKGFLAGVDRTVLNAFPWLRRWCLAVVIECTK